MRLNRQRAAEIAADVEDHLVPLTGALERALNARDAEWRARIETYAKDWECYPALDGSVVAGDLRAVAAAVTAAPTGPDPRTDAAVER